MSDLIVKPSFSIEPYEELFEKDPADFCKVAWITLHTSKIWIKRFGAMAFIRDMPKFMEGKSKLYDQWRREMVYRGTVVCYGGSYEHFWKHVCKWGDDVAFTTLDTKDVFGLRGWQTCSLAEYLEKQPKKSVSALDMDGQSGFFPYTKAGVGKNFLYNLRTALRCGVLRCRAELLLQWPTRISDRHGFRKHIETRMKDVELTPGDVDAIDYEFTEFTRHLLAAVMYLVREICEKYGYLTKLIKAGCYGCSCGSMQWVRIRLYKLKKRNSSTLVRTRKKPRK